MIVEAIGIGMVISFLLMEWIGLSAGGLIVPGYFALFADHPDRIAVSLAVALLTYWVLRGISYVTILYGRRRFMAAVLIGYLLGGVCRLLVTDFWLLTYDLRVIGYIIPGLIANDMVKQGVWKTVFAVLLASILVRLILLLITQ
ncbi:CapC protein [Candidatus Vecturithrix granuli]|uniref:CapC protein n=1 Tax=Vecturithrix granuli TaxID=1499967 RepID=A0A081C617_VECG1|nr:CapC protein [Candidatus Vecturithrix granuli]